MQGARFGGKRVASQLNGASLVLSIAKAHAESWERCFSRLKSGPDYTRLPIEARENMKYGLLAGRRRLSILGLTLRA